MANTLKNLERSAGADSDNSKQKALWRQTTSYLGTILKLFNGREPVANIIVATKEVGRVGRDISPVSQEK